MQVKVTEYNFRSDAIRWQMSKSTNFLFCLIYAFRYVTTCAKESNRHADTYRNGQAHSYRRQLVDLPKKSFLCTLKRQNVIPKYTFSTIIIPIMSTTVYFRLNECCFLSCFPPKSVIYRSVAQPEGIGFCEPPFGNCSFKK